MSVHRGMSTRAGTEVEVRKPRAVSSGSLLMPFAPASPADFGKVLAGSEELRRLGFAVADATPLAAEGYFAGPVAGRRQEFLSALERNDVDGLVAIRGGYGSTYVLESLELSIKLTPKIMLGYSDLTALQSFLWELYGWVGFYGPMVAAGFNSGAAQPGGYEKASLLAAIGNTDGGWMLDLGGETLVTGVAEGRVVGGCLTLVQTALSTAWELDTSGAILLLEDRAMKPWQVDRSLMHLKNAGAFVGVRGIILGDFPECEAPMVGSPSVRDVCRRILAPLGVPIVFGAPVGHTLRPMLTVPLGVRARLSASGEGKLDILEPAVVV